jgi:hypothetical protein
MVTVSAQAPAVGGNRTLSGGNKWLNAAIFVLIALLVVNYKSFIDSADEESLQKRIILLETKYNGERELLEDKIASLEAKLADL